MRAIAQELARPLKPTPTDCAVSDSFVQRVQPYTPGRPRLRQAAVRPLARTETDNVRARRDFSVPPDRRTRAVIQWSQIPGAITARRMSRAEEIAFAGATHSPTPTRRVARFVRPGMAQAPRHTTPRTPRAWPRAPPDNMYRSRKRHAAPSARDIGRRRMT